ncbi:MAG: DNA polymerase III subunit gamma/tau [Patescibacteria group bacterium]|jgi:DNA polymerase-3 subunit gamma/tau
MTVSLYRQYRPQTFAEVVGQNQIKVTLQNEIKQGKIAQAYLFSGPRGIGKTTTARLMAKAANCEKRKAGESEPCNHCAACEEITGGSSLDVLEIDAASHTGVDNVRANIIESARFAPSRLKNKVYIIDEVHMLSTAAFNALLKTLEEPPANVIFILCTTESHKLPLTIISRCQRFDFRRVAFGEVVDHLAFICREEGVSCDKEVLQNIARHSEGYLRDAVGLCGQLLSLGEKKITWEQAQLVMPRSNFLLVAEFLEYLVNRDTEKALRLVNRLVDEGVNLSQFVLDTVEFLRKLLLTKVSGRLDEFTLELDEAGGKKLTAILGSLSLSEIASWANIFISKNQAIKQSAIPQLPLELAVVEICGETENTESRIMKHPSIRGASESRVESQKAEIRKEKLEIGNTKPSTPSSVVSNQPKIEVQPTPSKKGGKGAVKLEEVEAKWGEFIASLNDSNHSLSMTLHVGRPLAVDGDTVRVGFKYKFHKEMMAESKNRLTLSEGLSKIMGVKLLVEPIVAENLVFDSSSKPSPEAPSGTGVADVAKMFGGKVMG